MNIYNINFNYYIKPILYTELYIAIGEHIINSLISYTRGNIEDKWYKFVVNFNEASHFNIMSILYNRFI